MGYLKIIKLPFMTNENLSFSGVPIIKHIMVYGFGWLVGCFGLNGPLRQYFSLYRAVSQREGERKEK